MSNEKKIDLEEKQKRFCQEYIIDLNGKQAAIRAGYSPHTAENQASRLLSKAKVQQYVAMLKEGVLKRNHISQDEILMDLIELKERCMQNVPVMYFDKVDKEWKHEGADYGEPVYKFDSQGAAKALDMLAKHTGFYEADNVQKTVSININHEAVEVERD